MRINFKEIKVYDLTGTEVEIKVHELVGNILKNAVSNKPQRSMELAKKIYIEGEYDFLSEDLLLVKNAIEESAQVSNIVKDAILKALE